MNAATLFVTVAAKCGHLAQASVEDIESPGEFEAYCEECDDNVVPVESLEDRGAWDFDELRSALGLDIVDEPSCDF